MCVREGKGVGKGMREVDLVIQCNPPKVSIVCVGGVGDGEGDEGG